MKTFILGIAWCPILTVLNILAWYMEWNITTKIFFTLYNFMAFMTIGVIVKQAESNIIDFEKVVQSLSIWIVVQAFCGIIWHSLYQNCNWFIEFTVWIGAIMWVILPSVTLLYHSF
jgi:hypothetical protein